MSGLVITGILLALGCGGVSEVTAVQERTALTLKPRTGKAPTVPHRVPHQQLDQNAPPAALTALRSFLFDLDHVEEKPTRSSLPSARGAYIKKGVAVNKAIKREFTHIHMEPGPGSQHLVLTDADARTTIAAGWGVKHPWSDSLTSDGFTLLMIYAPRDKTDLAQIKKIITAAWQLALSESASP